MPNYGKTFEQKFLKDWTCSFPGTFILRLYDTTNGYKSISNPCDFIAFNNNRLFLLEIKSHAGASIPFDAIPQYSQLILYSQMPQVRAGIVLWLYDKDLCLYVPVHTIKELMDEGEKSVGVRHMESHDMIVLPSVKKRVYLDTDYTPLASLKEGW